MLYVMFKAHTSDLICTRVYGPLLFCKKPEGLSMETKPTYEELEQRVKEFEKELFGFKRIEMELRESEDRLKSYYHATFEGIAISEQGKIIEVNHQLADMFGYERAELIGKEIIDLVAEEDREVVLRNIRSDFDQPYESKVLHKDGSILYIEVHGQQIQHQGRLARVTAIHDLSERKQAEEVLRESKQQLKHLFENANEGVFLLNLDGHFIRVNNRTVEIFGYSKEEFAGMTVHDVSHPEDLDISPEILQRFKSGEIENLIFEKRYIHKKGHMFYGQVSTSIVRDPEGNSLYFVSHLMDITERKQTEEALRKAHDNLEQRVKERTKELEIQKGGLKELNTAMKVLLKKREEDKRILKIM